MSDEIKTVPLSTMMKSFPKLSIEKSEEKGFTERHLENLYRVKIRESIEKGYFPYTPDKDGLVDTTLAVNMNGAKIIQPALQMFFKIRQAELGAETPEFVTKSSIDKMKEFGFDVDVLPKEVAFPVIYSVDGTPDGEKKQIDYYNINQIKNPEIVRDFFAKNFEQERLKYQQDLVKKHGENAFKVNTEYKPVKDIDYTSVYKLESKKSVLEKRITLETDEKKKHAKENGLSQDCAASIVSQIVLAGKKGSTVYMSPEIFDELKTSLSNVVNQREEKIIKNEAGEEIKKDVYKRYAIANLQRSINIMSKDFDVSYKNERKAASKTKEQDQSFGRA